MKAWPVLGITLIQAILFLAHWFLFHTWIVFWGPLSPAATHALGITLLLLSISFTATALISHGMSNWLVSGIYRLASVWLGLLNFLVWAAGLCWLLDLAVRVSGLPVNPAEARRVIAGTLLGLTVLCGVYGLVNAAWTRTRRVTVALPNLPESWRGRTALLLSDLHLGNLNGLRFSRRIATLARELNPDIIFIAGDLFDGTKVDAERLVAPLGQLTTPFGSYFVTGNHDEYGDVKHYLSAVAGAGIRVLANEKVTLDGLHVAGVSYGDTTYLIRLRTILEGLHLKDTGASILLNHVPNRLPTVEQAGVSLQLSGHTHGGQMFPFTWVTRRAFGKFTYGLQQFGALQVYTSTGVGTWGPPMRVGTHPEIVLITFA